MKKATCSVGDCARPVWALGCCTTHYVPRGPVPHGTLNGYANFKCRCHACRGANALVVRERRARRKHAGSVGAPHGTISGYDNWQCRCSDCKAANVARKALRDPEHVRRVNNAWSAANRDKLNARYRALYQRDKEKRKPQYIAYYRANRERLMATQRAWIAENIEQHREYQRRYQQARRVLRSTLPTYDVTERDWLRLCARHDNRCAYCGKPKKLTFDHVVPIARGGQHSIGNLLPACGTCNSSKGSKLLVEWRRRS